MNIEIVTANNFYKESMSALFAKNLGKLCAAKYNRDTLKVFILPDDADCIYLPHSSELLDADYAVVFCTPAIKRIFSGIFFDRNVCFITLDAKEDVLIEKLLAAMALISQQPSFYPRQKNIFERLTATEMSTLDFIMYTGQGVTLSKTQSLHKRNAMHKLGVMSTFELYCKMKLAEALMTKVKGVKGAYIDFLHTKGKFASDEYSSFDVYALSTAHPSVRNLPSDRFGTLL